MQRSTYLLEADGRAGRGLIVGERGRLRTLFPVGHLRRLRARRALTAGERARALLISRGEDPVILSELGMHRSALAALERHGARSRAEKLAHVLALATTGRPQSALSIARQGLRRSSAGWRRRAALAIAQVEPGGALDLFDQRDPHPLWAALLARHGQDEAAAALLQRSGVTSPDVELLRATLAIGRGDWDRHEASIEAALAMCGLAPVRRIDRDRPMSVQNVTASREPAVDGPLVSVVMAVRDVAPFLDAALGSILHQTWSNLELIVVDDGSVDGTTGLIEDWSGRDARVRLIRRAGSGGPYRARNAGLAAARGVFVTFQDGDDWSHPSRLERQTTPLLDDRRLIATAARWFRLDRDGHIGARHPWPLIRWHPASPLFRREPVLGVLGTFDEVRSGADCEYWARLCNVFGRARIRSLRLPLSLGADRPESLTRAPDTGFSTDSGNPSRLAYWEAWHLWHARSCAAGETPRMSPAMPRPFAAPADLLVPTDR